jgi:hypothetical protein
VTGGLPTAVLISFWATALVTLAWMIRGVREYRRTGRGTWLWLGVLMGVSLGVAFSRYPR